MDQSGSYGHRRWLRYPDFIPPGPAHGKEADFPIDNSLLTKSTLQITFFVGQLLNEVLNKVLKHTIKELRPVTRSHSYGEYGMPSNHSQFMSFFATYVFLFVLIRLPQAFNQNAFLERFWRLLIIVGTWLAALLVCYSRVYLQYHTWGQVLTGVAVGIATGSLWFALTQFFLSPFYPKVSLIACLLHNSFLLYFNCF